MSPVSEKYLSLTAIVWTNKFGLENSSVKFYLKKLTSQVSILLYWISKTSLMGIQIFTHFKQKSQTFFSNWSVNPSTHLSEHLSEFLPCNLSGVEGLAAIVVCDLHVGPDSEWLVEPLLVTVQLTDPSQLLLMGDNMWHIKQGCDWGQVRGEENSFNWFWATRYA